MNRLAVGCTAVNTVIKYLYCLESKDKRISTGQGHKPGTFCFPDGRFRFFHLYFLNSI